MNIFFSTTIFSRDRAKRLNNQLYKYNTKLNSLIEEKNQLYNSVDNSQPFPLIKKTHNKIKNLNKNIESIQLSLGNISYNIQYHSNFINRSDYDTNNLYKNYIHNLHNYGDLKQISFAPSYPIRLDS